MQMSRVLNRTRYLSRGYTNDQFLNCILMYHTGLCFKKKIMNFLIQGGTYVTNQIQNERGRPQIVICLVTPLHFIYLFGVKEVLPKFLKVCSVVQFCV